MRKKWGSVWLAFHFLFNNKKKKTLEKLTWDLKTAYTLQHINYSYYRLYGSYSSTMGQVWCQGPVQAELAWRSHSILYNIIYFSFVGEKDKAYRYQMSKVIQTGLKSVLLQSLFSFTELGRLSLSDKINCSSGWPTSTLFQEDVEWLLHGFCKPIRNLGW